MKFQVAQKMSPKAFLKLLKVGEFTTSLGNFFQIEDTMLVKKLCPKLT